LVFEQLYSVAFLKRKPWFAFVLGASYSMVGIAIALFTFPKDPALMAVALISILLLPSLAKLTASEERDACAPLGHRLGRMLKSTFKLTKPAIAIYLFAFAGIFMVFAFFSLALPQFASSVLFRQQLAVLTGQAFTPGLFLELLRNNLLVLVLCFVISLIAGNGSILFITWNASVWGTLFGMFAKTAATQIQGSPFILFLLILISVIPHTVLEMLSYVLSTISGTLLSGGLVTLPIGSERFGRLMRRAVIILVAAGVVLLLGALVETYVLDNFTTYAKIIALSFPG